MHDVPIWLIASELMETPPPFDVITRWIQLGATGVITGLLIWMITRWMPAEREKNRTEIVAEREIARKEMSLARDQFRESLAMVMVELAAERKSREEATNKFSEVITANRIASHEQRTEDRQIYQEFMRNTINDFLMSLKELRNGHS